MPTITAQKTIDKAEIILQDETNGRFEETELLGWFNDGERAIVALKPDAYIVEAAVKLVAGIVQSIPSTGISLIGVSRNMGIVDGTTPGNIIRLIDRRILDAQRPSWPTDTAAATVKFYMFDDRKPRKFEVYPPQPSSGMGYVMEAYVDTPADIAIGATMLLDDIYAIPLQHYIVATALSKDPRYAAVSEKHMNLFLAGLGAKEDAENVNDPNLRAKE